MRNLVLAAVLVAATSSCSHKKPVMEEPFDAALPPHFDAGPLGALYLLTIWPHSAAAGETIPCTEGFCSDRATHTNVGGAMSLVVNEAGLNMLFEARPGSTVTFDGHETKMAQPRQDATFPHMLARFADVPAGETSLEVDVKVVTPGMKSEAAKSKLDIGYLHYRVLKAKDGPVLFAGETTATPNAKKLAYFRPSMGGQPPVLIGSRGRWRDIDLVALVDVKHGTGEACPEITTFGIGGVGHGGMKYTPHVQTLHSDVTLYERRTGKVFDTHAFDSTGKCKPDPPDAGADASILGLGSLSMGPTTPDNDPAIEAWIKSKLAN